MTTEEKASYDRVVSVEDNGQRYVSGFSYFPPAMEVSTINFEPNNNVGNILYIREEITIDAITIDVIGVDIAEVYMAVMAPVDTYGAVNTLGTEVASSGSVTLDTVGIVEIPVTPVVLPVGFYYLAIQTPTEGGTHTLTLTGSNNAMANTYGINPAIAHVANFADGILVAGWNFRQNANSLSGLEMSSSNSPSRYLIGVRVQ